MMVGDYILIADDGKALLVEVHDEKEPTHGHVVGSLSLGWDAARKFVDRLNDD